MTDQRLSEKAETLLDYMKENGYICPWGSAWHKLWEMLPEKRQAGAGWEPPLPLVLTGWYTSSNLEKSMLMLNYIEWADRHSVIDKIDVYQRGIDPDVWHKRENSPYVDGGSLF